MAQVNRVFHEKTSNAENYTESSTKDKRFGKERYDPSSDSPRNRWFLHYNQFGPRRQHDCLQLNCEQI